MSLGTNCGLLGGLYISHPVWEGNIVKQNHPSIGGFVWGLEIMHPSQSACFGLRNVREHLHVDYCHWNGWPGGTICCLDHGGLYFVWLTYRNSNTTWINGVPNYDTYCFINFENKHCNNDSFRKHYLFCDADGQTTTKTYICDDYCVFMMFCNNKRLSN